MQPPSYFRPRMYSLPPTWVLGTQLRMLLTQLVKRPYDAGLGVRYHAATSTRKFVCIRAFFMSTHVNATNCTHGTRGELHHFPDRSQTPLLRRLIATRPSFTYSPPLTAADCRRRYFVCTGRMSPPRGKPHRHTGYFVQLRGRDERRRVTESSPRPGEEYGLFQDLRWVLYR